MSSVSVAELWWMDRRIATRDLQDRVRRPQTRDVALMVRRLADAQQNAASARALAAAHRRGARIPFFFGPPGTDRSHDEQARLLDAESDRQATYAAALASQIKWIMRDETSADAFAQALVAKFSRGSGGPERASRSWPNNTGPQPPPILANATTPRAPSLAGASVAA